MSKFDQVEQTENQVISLLESFKNLITLFKEELLTNPNQSKDLIQSSLPMQFGDLNGSSPPYRNTSSFAQQDDDAPNNVSITLSITSSPILDESFLQ